MHLVQGGVAAGDVVLGDAVHVGHAGEVVTQVVLGLQAQHVLKVDEGLGTGKEAGKKEEVFGCRSA